jgi:hypothetical protein
MQGAKGIWQTTFPMKESWTYTLTHNPPGQETDEARAAEQRGARARAKAKAGYTGD